ncbi:MAG: hypothetical protein H7839_18410 [Magnetococcus sp. YQC-5]
MILMKIMPRSWARFRVLTLSSLLVLFWSDVACAVEVAPRITDREIIQELVTIKTDLKANQDKTNQRFDDMNKRIDDINKRFDDINKRFDDANKRIEDFHLSLKGEIKAGQDKTNQRFDDTNKRFDDINKRFDDINKRIEEINLSLNKRIDDLTLSINKRIDDTNKRIEDLHHMTVTMFGALLGVMVAFIGFVLWDRRTLMKPLEERIVQNTHAIKTNQEFIQIHSNLLNQFTQIFREMAKKDPELSVILRNFSLL